VSSAVNNEHGFLTWLAFSGRVTIKQRRRGSPRRDAVASSSGSISSCNDGLLVVNLAGRFSVKVDRFRRRVALDETTLFLCATCQQYDRDRKCAETIGTVLVPELAISIAKR